MHTSKKQATSSTTITGTQPNQGGGFGTNSFQLQPNNNQNNNNAAAAGGGGGSAAGHLLGKTLTHVTMYQVHKMLRAMKEQGGDAKPMLYGQQVFRFIVCL